jgi:formylglycine-generating enzyme required for sulfatase activity
MKISGFVFFIILFSIPTYSKASEMVEIPAGSFVMGLDNDRYAPPQHRMYLENYSIDIYEVANEEFSIPFPEHPFWKGAVAHPVTDTSWQEAQSYCLKLGKRLPTEAEWEKAARGEDARLYPWGNKPLRKKTHSFYSGLIKRRVGLNKKDVSPYGVHDMAGSVWEWTASDFYKKKITRGGLWNFHLEYEFSKTFDRNLVAPSNRLPFIRFRCAR